MSVNGNGFAEVRWNEDGSATVYGRITARDATGTSVPGQGKCLKQADLSSITFRAYDEEDPDTTVNSGTVTVSSSIFDTLQTTADDPAWPFTRGFNFRHDLTPANFPTGDRTYVVEYKFTTTGGTVGWARYRGVATRVNSS